MVHIEQLLIPGMLALATPIHNVSRIGHVTVRAPARKPGALIVTEECISTDGDLGEK